MELPRGNITWGVAIRRCCQAAGNGQSPDGWNHSVCVCIGTGSRAGRRFFNKQAGPNDEGFPASTCYRTAWGDVVHVGIGANCLLHVANVEYAACAVRASLPCAGADEEDRDEGEQDKDDDRQFEEGHAGLALDGWCLC